jgi:hypothetical protein
MTYSGVSDREVPYIRQSNARPVVQFRSHIIAPLIFDALLTSRQTLSCGSKCGFRTFILTNYAAWFGQALIFVHNVLGCHWAPRLRDQGLGTLAEVVRDLSGLQELL